MENLDKIESAMKSEKMILHDMTYVIVSLADGPPVAYPIAGWDDATCAPRSNDIEQCDCLETVVHYYRLRRERLHSDGESVLSDRDVRVLDAVFDIEEGKPRAPRH